MQTRDAERILREQRASRGYASCFVNPNAVCPVCAASVFYYQNDRGSRVFFDDLGPPWPKHPCTDNPTRSASAISARPQPRARGIRLELAEAASFLGIYDGGRFHSSGYPIDWQMIEILSVERKGFQLFLTGQLIEMADGPVVYFSITCPEEIVVAGDVVSGCFSAISAFHPTKLAPRSYKVTWFENERFLKVSVTGEHALRPLREPSTFISIRSEGPTPAAILIRRSKTPRARPKSATPPRAKDNEAKSRPRPDSKGAKPLRAKKLNADPKPESAKQLKRDEMISKVVVEYRRGRHSRSPKDGK
ncbi:hypothetical protein [Mesorhizobium sp. B2-3-15]|uniref:hypothetical protein n=1 Tax=Mesorhizobium sp. B2-3-15 TaxID=2589949 RepID=UPI00112765AD|nr:hypothetical protein [Mesorhizobium sp. B2-3-15]TPL71391.1 hypothetical protein FJ954_17420 [Mesorhizobium sp. B2-3-15]